MLVPHSGFNYCVHMHTGEPVRVNHQYPGVSLFYLQPLNEHRNQFPVRGAQLAQLAATQRRSHRDTRVHETRSLTGTGAERTRKETEERGFPEPGPNPTCSSLADRKKREKICACLLPLVQRFSSLIRWDARLCWRRRAVCPGKLVSHYWFWRRAATSVDWF